MTPEETVAAAICVRHIKGKPQYPGGTQNCAGHWDGRPSLFVHPECAVAALERAGFLQTDLGVRIIPAARLTDP